MWTTRLALWILRRAKSRVDCLLVITPHKLKSDKHVAQSVAAYLVDGAGTLIHNKPADKEVTLRCSVQVDE